MVDYPLALANILKNQASTITWCLLSGQGADRTERSRFSFAKYKGEIENSLSHTGFQAFYTFRPAYIYPAIPRSEPSRIYALWRILYPLLKHAGSNISVPSTTLARVIFHVGLYGWPQEIFENTDIVHHFNVQEIK